MNLAPIALFVYNRLSHTKRTIEALQKNRFAAESELFVFSDGARNAGNQQSVDAVRSYIHSITGFKKVTVIERPKNYGLANNIIDGVTSVVNRFEQIIVLEDDLVTSPWFLQYMNQGLDTYRDNHQVVCIHGYVYPVKEKLPETFFLKGADCWGWATWKRGWDLFEPDGKKLMDELVQKNLTREFDYDGAYDFTLMLSHQIKGINDSWAIRWQASAYLKDKLTLYPGRSLLHNIGVDGSGVHSGSSNIFDVPLSAEPITVKEIPAVADPFSRNAFVNFFRSVKPGILSRAFTKFKTVVKNVITKNFKTLV
jgi:hypothetical protein